MRFIHIIITFALVFPFIAIAQTPDEILSWMPEIKDWKKPVSKEVFNPDNLFDRINGAAPLFIENGFQEMTTCDYKQGDDYITIQVYRHATPEDAFGMYSSERSLDLTFYKIGGEAHGDNGSFYFFSGSVYVKIRSKGSNDKIGEAMRNISEAIASKASTDAAYPDIIKSFPKNNVIPYTQAYITSNYIGHEFLNKVFLCQYRNGDLKYQLFVVNAENSDAAKEILKKYIAFTKQTIDLKEGELSIKDRYNGDIPILWKGKYLIGIFNEDGKNIPNAQAILKSVKL